jgi:hypothetical protein
VDGEGLSDGVGLADGLADGDTEGDGDALALSVGEADGGANASRQLRNHVRCAEVSGRGSVSRAAQALRIVAWSSSGVAEVGVRVAVPMTLTTRAAAIAASAACFRLFIRCAP